MTLKKNVLPFILLILTSQAFAQNEVADGGVTCSGIDCLPIITQHTRAILKEVNNIPGYLNTYLTPVTKMAQQWLQTKDDQNTIANNLQPFSNYASSADSILEYQIDNTVNFTKAFLMAGTNKTSSTDQKLVLPSNSNQLTYSIIYGQPIDGSKYPRLNAPGQSADEKNKISQQLAADINGYIKNLSGSNYIFKQPTSGNSDDIKNYRTMYNMLSSIQSYNTFILSSLYYQNFSDDLTKKLMNNASKDTWITQIGSEDLGLVLRHVLMYCTGMFMQLNRIQQLQQQQVTLLAMNNVLQAVNMANNVSIISNAKKNVPSSSTVLPQ